MLTLYYFCSRWEKPAILQNGLQIGLCSGEVLISHNEGFSAFWLTSDPTWGKSTWMDSKQGLDSSSMRVSVRIREDDPNLLTWEQVCRRYCVSPYFEEKVGRTPLGQAGWFVYLKHIPTGQVGEIAEEPSAPPLCVDDFPEELIRESTGGTPRKPKRLRDKLVERDSMLHEWGHWVRRKNVEFPWSDIPSKLLRLLGRTDPEKAVERGLAYCERYGLSTHFLGKDSEYPVILTMAGVSRWMQSKRRLLSVSPASSALLGDWEPRFGSLPYISESPWKHGMCFSFGQGSERKSFGMQVLVYAEPLQGLASGIRYVLWSRNSDGRWGTAIPNRTEPSKPATYTSLDYEDNTAPVLAIAMDGTRIPLERFRTVCVNGLAAFHEEPRLFVGTRKAPKRRGRAGGVGRTKRITLTEDGARLILRRWITVPREIGDGPVDPIERGDRQGPCLHTVQPHMWRVWVNKPEEGEVVLETRERETQVGTHTQYRVRRVRGRAGAFTRGKGLRPKVERLVTGADDTGTGG